MILTATFMLWMTLTCWASGKFLLRPFLPKMNPCESLIFGTALGLGLLAYSILLLGLFHLLNDKLLVLLLILWSIPLLFRMRVIKTGFQNLASYLLSDISPSWLLFYGTPVLIILGAAWAGVLTPETANDSLCYHIHLPKVFLSHQTIGRIPCEINSLFPLLSEMLDTFGVAFNQISLSKSLHLLCGILSAGLLLTRIDISRHKQTAFWGAFLLFSTPGLVNQYGTTYVDVTLTLFSGILLFAYLRWHSTGDIKWLVTAGIAAGFAMSIKYLALISVMIVSALIILDRWRKMKTSWNPLLYFWGVTFVFCAYWYIRSWIETGNPVYPYFYQIFKSGEPITYDDIGTSKTFFHFFLLPWLITMKPTLFEGFGDNIGPAFLAFAPLSWIVRFEPLVKRLAAFSFCYILLWFFLGQSLRFLFPVLPALIMLAVYGFNAVISQPNSAWPKKLLSGAVFVTLLVNAGLAVYHYRYSFPVALGFQTSESYLLQHERSYQMAQYVNQHLPQTAKILNATEVHMFYFDRPILREDRYAIETQYDQKSSTESEIIEKLKAAGFTHLLLCFESLSEYDRLSPLRVPRIFAHNQKSLAETKKPSYTSAFTDSDKKTYTYQLYELSANDS